MDLHSLAKNSLVQLLRTFSEEENKRFEQFLNSPYHNSIANVRKLFREMKKFAPGYSGDNFTREYLWKKTFPEKKFNYCILKTGEVCAKKSVHYFEMNGLKYLYC